MKPQVFSYFSGLLTVCLLLLVIPNCIAQSAPALINYQGKLTDASGNPLPNGPYAVAIRIWSKKDSAQPADTLIWGQEYSVAIVNGIFNVILGSSGATPIPNAAVTNIASAFTNSERYIGLTVTRGTNGLTITNASEIIPRQQILSNPFALSASIAGTVPDGAITGAKLANGAVDSAQIANGAVGPSQLAAGAIPFVPHNIQVFTASGTWIKPANVTTVYVKVIGRGGNGAGGNDSQPRGGGGGGGYAEGPIAVTGNVTVTIGSVNSFAGTTTIQATSGADASGQYGGAGGIGSGGVINLRGGSGQNVSTITNQQGGTGGGTPMGSGGSGGALLNGTTYISEGNGGSYGGGGGGATNVGHSGGTGDSGAVIVYY